jgi:putative membrane protein
LLVLISCFERKVVILPDKGLKEIMNEPAMSRIIGLMKPALKRSEFRKALEIALAELACSVSPAGTGVQSKNEISDSIIEEEK